MESGDIISRLITWLWSRLQLAFAGLAVLIPFSRIYVSVHYPTDVLADAEIGAPFALAAIAIVERARYSRKPCSHVIART